MTKTKLRAASRKSPLAMAQTRAVIAALKERYGFAADIVGITAEGDTSEKPLADIGGKMLFVRALQNSISAGNADFAVHSLKDMECSVADDFVLAAVGFGEDARDVLISASGAKWRQLPKGARIGTCSPRRAAIALDVAPHFHIVPMRGNIGTRLKKMRGGECDALILAAAGLHRLGLRDLITEYLPPDVFVPASCQGLIGIECLADNDGLINTLAKLGNDNATMRARAERFFAAQMNADCHTPLGAHARIEGGNIRMSVCHAFGGKLHYASATSSTPTAAAKSAATAIRRKQQCISG
ncbi:MAG: hydroxymethylbilane synthase [Gammaproteobacteria bacterium]